MGAERRIPLSEWGRATRFGAGGLKTCAKCGRVCVRGSDLCVRHGAHRQTAALSAGQAALRTLARLDYAGLLPGDLVRLPVWQRLGNADRETRGLLRLALVEAWDRRDREPGAWAAVWRRAVSAAQAAPRERAWTWVFQGDAT